MNPASTTRSGAWRSISAARAASKSARSACCRKSTTPVATPFAAALASPPACGRSAITAATRAGRPASSKASMLLPRPEIRITTFFMALRPQLAIRLLSLSRAWARRCLMIADGQRRQRQGDDRQDHQRQVVLDERQIPEPVARQRQREDPDAAAQEVHGDEARIGHAPHPGDEGGEGTRDRQEARDDDRLAAVRFVIGVGLVERRPVEEARLLPAEHLRPEIMADPVIDVVAENRRRQQHRAQHRDVHAAGGRQRSGDEQQRIAGQERRHHEAGFHEDDQEQDGVDPRAVVGEQHRQMLVQVKHDVDEARDQFHGRLEGSAHDSRTALRPHFPHRRPPGSDFAGPLPARALPCNGMGTLITHHWGRFSPDLGTESPIP